MGVRIAAYSRETSYVEKMLRPSSVLLNTVGTGGLLMRLNGSKALGRIRALTGRELGAGDRMPTFNAAVDQSIRANAE